MLGADSESDGSESISAKPTSKALDEEALKAEVHKLEQVALRERQVAIEMSSALSLEIH